MLRQAAGRTGAAALAVAAAAALAGCAQEAAASGPVIQPTTAYVSQQQGANPTDAYVVIRNNGPADRLVAVRTSAGGTVTLRGPGRPGTMRDVPAIRIAGHSLVRLDPNGYHLVISGARPLRSGSEITLTLVFARAGTFQVAAEVTNAQTGGSSYFLN